MSERDLATDFRLLEYEALRAEMNRRGAVRYQILLAVYTLLAALFALQFGTDAGGFPVVVLFPILQYPFAALWSHNYRRTLEMSDYIADEVEALVHGGWETRMRGLRNRPRGAKGALVSATAARGQFAICGVLALLVGAGVMVADGPVGPVSLIALILAGAALAVTRATLATSGPAET